MTGWAGVLVALAVLALSGAAEACPMCKEALFDLKEAAQRVAAAKGYALSIALMVSMPAILVGSVATLVVRAHRLRAPNMMETWPRCERQRPDAKE